MCCFKQLAVDGLPTSEHTIVRQVRGTDIVGSKVKLTVRKGGVGQVFDVSLVRGAWGAVERKERLFILFDELHKLIKIGVRICHVPYACAQSYLHARCTSLTCVAEEKDSRILAHVITLFGISTDSLQQANKDQLEHQLDLVVMEAKEYEKYRAISEMTIHDRLHALQVCLCLCPSVFDA